MRSKRFEVLSERPINQDGFVKEWVEEGLIVMESLNDPKPSIKGQRRRRSPSRCRPDRAGR